MLRVYDVNAIRVRYISAHVFWRCLCGRGRMRHLLSTSQNVLLNSWHRKISMLRRHIPCQHLWVVDKERNRKIYCHIEFTYSSLLDRMITWLPSLTTIIGWRWPLIVGVRHCGNCTASFVGKFLSKSKQLHDCCLRLACDLWRTVNLAVCMARQAVAIWMTRRRTSKIHNIVRYLL